jgi:hypothetical protein
MRDVSGVGDGRHMPTTQEVHASDDYIVSKFDTTKPIDFDVLKSEIEKNGPVQSVFPEQNTKFVFNITECQCSEGKCDHDCITLSQISGFTTLTTSISKELFLRSDSFDEFIAEFRHFPMAYFSSSAEEQHFEGCVEEHLGFAPMDVYTGKISPEQVMKAVKLSDAAKADNWLAHNLFCGFNLLLSFRATKAHHSSSNCKAAFKAEFTDNTKFSKFLQHIYDMGFLSGRLISEHFIRNELEPVAEKGVAAKQAQESRTRASGLSANQKRHSRIDSMLSHMEALADENPALLRLGVGQLAKLAIEDSSSANSKLWSQGKGQRDEYLDEMRSDVRYQKRFHALTAKTA